MEFDILIRGGSILDGLGSQAVRADVGVQGDRISAIGDLSAATSTTVIEAEGKTVTPGFIDTHTHSDTSCFLPDDAFDARVAALRQGVTTEISGNCGFTPFPLDRKQEGVAQRLLGPFMLGAPLDWSTLAEYAERVEQQGIHANLAPLVGHGTVRATVLGFDHRSPDSTEMDIMRRLVRESMEMGALGLSSGLIYAPGQYAATREVADLAAIAAEFGRPYCTHMRGETDMVAQSVTEVLTIGKASGAAVHISHHKVAGRANWGRTHETLGMMDEARRNGMDVTCDVYPYTAGSTMLLAILPGWVQEGGLEPMLDRLRDRNSRDRIVREWEEPSLSWENMVKAAGWGSIFISTCLGRPEYQGRSISELSKDTGKSPADVTFDLLVDQRGAVTMVIDMMHEDDMRRVLAYEGSMIGSDGIPLPGKPHPRWAGTFTRVLGRYGRDEGLLSLPQAIRKMTSQSAQRFGLSDRGVLAEGKIADFVVLDPQSVMDRATYDDPLLLPLGIDHVIVNGVPVVAGGELTGATPGRVVLAGA